MIRPAVLACSLLAAAGCGAQPVRIGIFGLFHPGRLDLRPAAEDALIVNADDRRMILAGADTLHCSARAGAAECTWHDETFFSSFVSASSRGGRGFILAVPGKIERRFQGELEIASTADALVPVVVMDIETAVASAVAAESPPGAPVEALKAQAVVARSYYAAARGRHRQFDFCDTTHCQFIRQPPEAHDLPAQAALDTRGVVLAFRGAPFAAFYSASCGGRTRTLPASDAGYPYYPVECPYCARTRRARCSYCVHTTGPWANRRGTGAGHGVGLCQTGAAVMAAEGATFRSILEHYFPNTTFLFMAR